MLSKEEINRYNRHVLLPEIGMEGQKKLKHTSVLIIGAGGLGCPAMQYLTAAGIGTIGIVDFDSVDETNLQRQVLYTIDDIGKPKVECAIHRLSRLNPFVKFVPYYLQLTNTNAINIIKNYDIIIDGSDNFVTRYLVNDACVLLNKPLVYGSIYKFEGQVSVFNYSKNGEEKGPTYRCLFPNPPAPESSPSCSETGVLGFLPGIVGTLQANEAIKISAGIGDVLSGQLSIINALTMQFYSIAFERNKAMIESAPSNLEQYIDFDYGSFCNSEKPKNVNEITSEELNNLINQNRNAIQIVDVRAIDEEPKLSTLKELQIPFADIVERADKIDSRKKVVVVCKLGIRSAIAIQLLQKNLGLTNLYNLKGGVTDWVKKFNP